MSTVPDDLRLSWEISEGLDYSAIAPTVSCDERNQPASVASGYIGLQCVVAPDNLEADNDKLQAENDNPMQENGNLKQDYGKLQAEDGKLK